MPPALRILSGIALLPVIVAGAVAAPVPTERVTAPRALEPAPGVTLPPGSLDAPAPDPGQPGAEDTDPETPASPEQDPQPVEREPETETVIESEEEPVLPKIHYGEEGLPAAVRQVRKDILEATRTADYDRLRLIYDANLAPPTLSFGEIGDPIEFLRQSSGDPDGYEILAILTEVMEAGWVHLNPGAADEMFVWPYFAEIPLEFLTPSQNVELLSIVTAADLEEMQTYGAYIFYRVGIGPDGEWYFFVAGD